MVEYKNPRGMRDFLPELAVKKKFIEKTLSNIFEKYGYLPLETPIVEEFQTLATKGSGEEIKKEIYYFKDQAQRELGLRFDLTIPLARVVASNPNLLKPFKRYQIGPVYRYDRPQALRYREFTQADADIVGCNSVLSDFEIIAIVVSSFKELKIDFSLRINNRKLLADIVKLNEVSSENTIKAFRIIDKLDKIGWNGVESELTEKGISTKIVSFLKERKFENLKEFFSEKNFESEGFKEIQEVMQLVNENGLGRNVMVDLSLARGLEYYTGIVYEIMGSGQNLSCGGGGRYDTLVEGLGGPKIAAVGISFGVERVMDLISNELNLQKLDLFLIPIGPTQKEVLKLTQELRELGLNCDMDLVGKGISKNLSYADKKNAKYSILIGENELKDRRVTLRNMKSGDEKKVSLNALEIKQNLG